MDPVVYAPAEDSSDADIEALEQLSDRLLGFGVDSSLDWIDGFLTCLATAPSVPAVSEWLGKLSGDQFERVFADPQDHDQALRLLTSRLDLVREHLNPERLLDNDGTLHLSPLIGSWRDDLNPGWEDNAQLRELRAEMLARAGEQWASGFVMSLSNLEPQWSRRHGANPAADRRWDLAKTRWLSHIAVLLLDSDSDDYRRHLAENYGSLKPPIKPSRDELVDAALFAVQELRLEWLDRDLTPATRHVAPQPGRNDPCHCGSGKKFKKCHGA